MTPVSKPLRKWRIWRENAWLILLTVQAPTCAICGRSADVIDHDHDTGVVRGLLCRGCNSLEKGPGRTHPNHVRYRENPPAAELGEPIMYEPYPGEGDGDMVAAAKDRGPTKAELIAELLLASGELSVVQMARTLEMTEANVRAVLSRLAAKEVAYRTVRKTWRLR